MTTNDAVRTIQWYPGHMAKTRRLLQDQLKRVDLLIEVCDARIPKSSRNPELKRLAGNKKHLLLMNKADLADPVITERWKNHFRISGTEVRATDFSKISGKEALSLIERPTKDLAAKALEKGIRKTVRAMIVGIPNVGKSTLINRLYGRNITQTGDRPGVTRSNQWVRVSPYLEILDTPGLLWPKFDDQEAARRLCYIGSIKDDVLDLYDLVMRLLEELCDTAPQQVMERFRFSDPLLRGVELLDAVCAGRGWLLKGNQFDYDRCCSVVLDEFRAGKIGRFSLESPEQRKKETEIHVGQEPARPGIDAV